MEDGVFKPTTKGTPQGGVMTPQMQKATLYFYG
jgi:retron-type reverse transcriptase